MSSPKTTDVKRGEINGCERENEVFTLAWASVPRRSGLSSRFAFLDSSELIRAFELRPMMGRRIDFVVKDEHQVTERSFAALRMTVLRTCHPECSEGSLANL
jgi:hypothetical protein